MARFTMQQSSKAPGIRHPMVVLAVFVGILFLLGVGAATPVTAQAVVPVPWQEPHTVLLLRHTLAPGTGDPPGMLVEECATQRNLSDTGRVQARELGDRLRAAGLSEARVYSSRWCRCLETAQLLDLGPVEPLPALDSFFGKREEGEGRTEAARQALRALGSGPPAVMVTHRLNIMGLTDRSLSAGAGLWLRVHPDGRLEILEPFP